VILTRRSLFLRDIFALPQPCDAYESPDTYLMIVLDDTEEDKDYMLGPFRGELCLTTIAPHS
jgi:hypothetical protein